MLSTKLRNSANSMLLPVLAASAMFVSGCGGGGEGGFVNAPATSTSYAISEDAKVGVAAGILQGLNLNSGVTAFLGVPFAAPPVGALRWKAPQPVVAWTGTRAAQTLPPAQADTAPVTLDGSSTVVQASEDCLYMNMWVLPKTMLPASGSWPVVVYLHGNGNNASQYRTNGERLAKMGILVVLPQRRQGIFGGLALPALSAESENGGTSGNFELQDAIASLQWVHDNISKFGGDAGLVTLMGFSQGASKLASIQSAPSAKGLFQRAMAVSGSGLHGTSAVSGTPLATAEGYGLAWMAKFGSTSGTTKVADVAGLRAKSTAEILKVSAGSVNLNSRTPQVDSVLPDAPSKRFLNGTQTDVPLFLGYSSDEGSAIGTVTDVTTYKAAINTKFGTQGDDVFNLYPAYSTQEAIAQSIRLNNDFDLGNKMISYARLQRAKGQAPVYMFKFYRGNTPGAGALHTHDTNYWFGNLDASYSDNSYPYTTPADYRLSDAMMKSLVSFVKTGNPTTTDATFTPYVETNQKQTGLDIDTIWSVPISKGADWFISKSDQF